MKENVVLITKNSKNQNNNFKAGFVPYFELSRMI